VVITMLWVFVFFVAVVANVGQAVNRRIALQVVADAGAYTGGSVLATGMNQLAYWNRQIQRMWGWVSTVSLEFNLGECVSSYATIAAYYGAHAAFVSTQLHFAQLVRERPQAVSEYNMADLFPHEDPSTFSFSHSDTDPDAHIVNTNLVGDDPALLVTTLPVDDGTTAELGEPLWNSETPYDYIPDPPSFLVKDSSGGSDSWTCYDPPTEVETVEFVHPVAWWKLQKIVTPVYFIWRVKAPAIKALMFDSIIGPNAIPEMKAVAVVKPVGDGDRRGNIEKGDIGYRVKVVPASKAMFIGYIYDQFYKGIAGMREVTH
jgi:hypothetical protein